MKAEPGGEMNPTVGRPCHSEHHKQVTPFENSLLSPIPLETVIAARRLQQSWVLFILEAGRKLSQFSHAVSWHMNPGVVSRMVGIRGARRSRWSREPVCWSAFEPCLWQYKRRRWGLACFLVSEYNTLWENPKVAATTVNLACRKSTLAPSCPLDQVLSVAVCDWEPPVSCTARSTTFER